MRFLFDRKARAERSRAKAAARAAQLAREAWGSGPPPPPDEDIPVDHWLAGPVRETGIPRWRRQSLIAARKGIPTQVQADAPLRFDGELATEVRGMELLRVRYRLVRLLDVAGDGRGTEVALLDEGDEVAVIERQGMYCHVLCPDGSEGWVHRMTLGSAPPPDAPGPGDGIEAGDEPGVFAGELAPESLEDLLRATRDLREGEAP